MPESLIRAKIKEALMAAGHNRHDAHKLLLTWAIRDPALLLAMTKPHLKAIAAGLVDHYVRQHPDTPEEDGSPEKLSRSTIDDIVAPATAFRPINAAIRRSRRRNRPSARPRPCASSQPPSHARRNKRIWRAVQDQSEYWNLTLPLSSSERPI